jgi:hypothetical protein
MLTFFVKMKNCCAFLFTLLCLTSIYSQEVKRVLTRGVIVSDSLTIENAHIINKTTLKGAFTTKKGTFSLPIKMGDVIYISHINFNTKEIIINSKSLAKGVLKIQIDSKTYALEEVSIKKKRSIFYVDPEIMPNSVLNATTLKLPFSNGKKLVEDKSTLKIKSGVSVNLVSFINVLNGNRKKEKELANAKKRDHKIDELRAQFSNSFFYHQLKIQKGHINLFLEYCVEKGLFQFHKKDNILKLTHFLVQISKTYMHQKLNENVLLTKK